VLVVGTPVVARAEWPQFQGNAAHDGITDGPVAPFAVAWTQRDISLENDDAVTGLSSPSIAPDGTVVVVAPGAVKTFDPEDGTELLSVERDLGPANQPAVADGTDGPIVVFTEGFGDEGPSATATPSPSPSPTEGDDEEFDSHVRAIALDTGEDVWTTPVPLEDIVQTPVAVDGSTAYVGDVGGRVTAIDVTSGEVRWTAEVGSVIAGAVTVAEGRALVTAFGGRNEASEVVAFDAETGEEAFRASLEEASNLVSTPVVADGRILVLDAIGGVLAFDATDGRSLWRTEVINPIAPSGQPFLLQGVGAPAPVSSDGRVFAVDVTGRAYAFDAENGDALWDHALNDPSRFSPPVLADGQLLVPTDSGTLSAIDTETGHLVWQVDGGADFLRGLADAGDRIVGATGLDDGGLVAFEPDPDGTLRDEPSPTTFDAGALLAGFVLGGLLLGVAVLLLVRPLQRRLAPSPTPAGDEPDPSAGPA
jgi:outer membrane protein assembly factor BamB